MIEVCHVEVRPDYHLFLRFNNGESRLFNMEPYLKYPVFKRLQNPVIFSLAQVNYGTVTWLSAIDIAPETLYGQSKPDQPKGKGGAGRTKCLKYKQMASKKGLKTGLERQF